jgi:DinB family protein
MKYLMMTRADRDALWRSLDGMPRFLAERFAPLSAAQARRPGPDGAFSPVEQCWHLADLEREGFGARIRRLLEDTDPRLADFDGARVARERDYRARSLAEGIRQFREARAANLALLRSLVAAQWPRAGTQEGVGRVALCDIPHMMAEHDDTHRAEIEAWGAT